MADSFLSSVENKASGRPSFLQEGLDIVKTFEGFKPDAYYDLDNKAKKGKLTVGYGFTNFDIPQLNPNYKISKAEAEKLLPSLIDRKYSVSVLENVKVPLSDNQFSALTSLVYNIGPNNFKNSTLLKKLNNGDFEGAKSEFGKWIYAGGKPMEGLRRRREAEMALFSNDREKVGRILEQQKFGRDLSQASPEQKGIIEALQVAGVGSEEPVSPVPDVVKDSSNQLAQTDNELDFQKSLELAGVPLSLGQVDFGSPAMPKVVSGLSSFPGLTNRKA